jgi:hypothetical protein
MLVFPSLGSQAEVSQDGFELRMSVEHHNVPGIPRQVNTFLKTLRTHTANKQVVSGQSQWPVKPPAVRGTQGPTDH